MGDTDPEAHRLNGPSLANDTSQVFQIGCVLNENWMGSQR
jgi:hypothetical protein